MSVSNRNENFPVILVVDDEPSNLATVSELLAGHFEVCVASDGEMALETLEDLVPDLIMLDLFMPGADGFETCTRIKQHPRVRDVPVIFATASNAIEHRIRAFEVGAIDYVCKPFVLGEIVSRFRIHLEVRRMTNELRAANRKLLDEVEVRALAEAELRKVYEHLAQRTKEIEQANGRLSEELRERERTDRERLALHEEIISMQKNRIEELSTPVIPIAERVLAIPIIGTLDEARSNQLLTVALEGARTHEADFLLLDLTGARSTVDGVEDVLMLLEQGLRLLGTTMILTGIRPDAALHLVRRGADLSRVVTCRSLLDGVAHVKARVRRRH